MPTDDTPTDNTLSRGFLARAAVGGAMMGLANLVPGISGGTMLVAAGVYTRFIDAISNATRLRLTLPTLATLGVIAGAAAVAIGALAGVIALGLAEFRWGMYSLFIGLTLGGVPIMLRLVRPLNPAAIAGTIAGIGVMIALVVLQSAQTTSSGASTNPYTLALAGAAGASAMILPGVSGAYLLLILGQYEAIITAIKNAIKAGTSLDVSAALAEAGTLVPVGIGVVLGIVVVGNLLRFVLHRYEKATLGVLLGLLLAAPAGLYPFKEGIRPAVGEVFEGEVVTEESIKDIDPKDWPERFFTPSPGHIGGSLALIVAGCVATLGIARIGKNDDPAEAS